MAKRIFKRQLTTDRLGHFRPDNSESIIDNGRTIHHLVHRHAQWCSSCGRRIIDDHDLRGFCDYCRQRRCCSLCETHCKICSRRLCSHCRRGFVGNSVLTVCPVCLAKLNQRQRMQDEIMVRKIALQRHLLLQRERTRIEALKLQAAKARLMAQLQYSRLSSSHRLALLREVNKVKLALVNLWQKENGRKLRLHF